MEMDSPLPPGQREIDTFPRFGLTPFAVRFPTVLDTLPLRIGGDVETPIDAGTGLERLARVEQCSDFHCVTTWTRRGLRWGGVRFSDFYHQVVVPLAGPSPDARFVVLRGQDGARTSLPLDDLLAPDVLLADRLDGLPLPIAHGAPLRLVAPAHYGYKSVKHLDRIEFWRSGANYRPVGLRFMVHPRARVAAEERGQWVPGWLLRYLYRPLIRPTAARFDQAMQQYAASHRPREAESPSPPVAR
jgi:DMSO/TMAO reductase YedYZ molybdopterin-dependent catalytic subunit